MFLFEGFIMNYNKFFLAIVFFILFLIPFSSSFSIVIYQFQPAVQTNGYYQFNTSQNWQTVPLSYSLWPTGAEAFLSGNYDVRLTQSAQSGGVASLNFLQGSALEMDAVNGQILNFYIDSISGPVVFYMDGTLNLKAVNGANVNLIFSASSSSQVTFDTHANVTISQGSSIINNGNTQSFLVNNGTLIVNGSLISSENFINNASGFAFITGTLTANGFTNYGNILNSGSSIFSGPAFNNDVNASINNTSKMNFNGSMINTGGASIINYDTLNFNSSVTNSSNAIISNLVTTSLTGVMNFNGSLSNITNAVINNEGTINFYGNMSNSGTFNNYGAVVNVNNSALFNQSGTLTLNSQTRGSLVIGSTLNLNGNGTFNQLGNFTIYSGSSLNVNDGFVVNQSGTLSNFGQINFLGTSSLTNSNSILNSGIINFTSQALSNMSNGVILNDAGGTFNVSNGSLLNSGLFRNLGSSTIATLTNSAGASISNSGSMTIQNLTNQGSFTNTATNPLTVSGNFVNSGGAFFSNQGSNFSVAGNLSNLGSSTIENNGTWVKTGGIFNNGTGSDNNSILLNSASLSLNGTVLNNFAQVTNTGTMNFDSTSRLNNFAKGVITNSGTLNVDTNLFNATQATLINNGGIANFLSFVNTNNGQIINNNGGFLTINGAILNSRGSITNNSGTMQNTTSSSLANLLGGSIENKSTVNWTKMSLTNGGIGDNASAILNRTGGAINFTSNSVVSNYAVITNDANASISFDSTSSLNNVSGGIVNNFGTLQFANGGTLSNTGQITNNGTISVATFTNQGLYHGAGFFNGAFINQGNVLPGNSPGLMTFSGPYTEQGTLIIGIENNGLAAANQAASFLIWGTARIDGSLDLTALTSKLQVDLLSGFMPSVGDTFEIVDYFAGQLSGVYANLNLPTLAVGNWLILYNQPSSYNWGNGFTYQSIVLQVTLPEPSTYLMLGSFLIVLGFVWRKKNSFFFPKKLGLQSF